MYSFGKLTVQENVRAFAQLKEKSVEIYVPKKMGKSFYWKNKRLFAKRQKATVIELWGHNPGVVLSLHRALTSFLEDDSKEEMTLPIQGCSLSITKQEASYLEPDIKEIAEYLNQNMMQKMIRQMGTIQFAASH